MEEMMSAVTERRVFESRDKSNCIQRFKDFEYQDSEEKIKTDNCQIEENSTQKEVSRLRH